MSNAADLDFDVVIIGGGSAGYAAARTASHGGLRTAVIEGGSEIGGLCILRGCMPTKALLYAAEIRHLIKNAHIWGLVPGEVGVQWERVIGRKDELIREFADYRREQLEAGKFVFIRARARFVTPNRLQLSDGRSVFARFFVVSTGSVVASPPLPQLSNVGCLTSDDALSLKELPRSMIVLGGGAVAVELAQFFVRFGVEVTLIQRSAHILRDFDDDAAEVLENVLRREGVRLFTNTSLLDARCQGQSKLVTFAHEGRKVEIKAESILFALGRTPNIGGLGLEKAGVETENGRIITNERMQTNIPNVYAAGDCTGPYEIVHLAIQQGETAARNILGTTPPRTMDYRLLINVIFTEPQIGQVGLTEKAAKMNQVPYLTSSYPFSDHGKSLIMEAKDGFVKLLAHRQSGVILGGACVGPQGGELIHEVVAAMAKHMTVHELAAMPHYHPTLMEIWTYPADDLAEQILV